MLCNKLLHKCITDRQKQTRLTEKLDLFIPIPNRT